MADFIEKDTVLAKMLYEMMGGEDDVLILRREENGYSIQSFNDESPQYSDFFKTRELAEKAVDIVMEVGRKETYVDVVRKVQEVLEGQPI